MPADFLLIETNLGSRVSATSGAAALAEQAKSGKAGRDTTNVRRPLRGIQIKEDTFATMTVSGNSTLYNSSAKSDSPTPSTSNFILQSVTESRSEKFQPVTTFGNTYGFFFGEQPRTMSFTAILLNTADFQWEIEWWANYEEFLRGTRLTDKQAKAYMTFDDVVVEGYLIGANTRKSAENHFEVMLDFTMWVTAVETLVTPGDPKFPISGGGLSVGISPREWESTEVLKRKNVEALLTESSVGVGPSHSELVTSSGGFVPSSATSIAASPAPGLLNSLRGSLDKVTDFVGRAGTAVRNAIAFLQGRSLVIPKGFAGSDVTVGAAHFGSSLGRAEVNINGTLVVMPNTVRVPRPYGQFWDNVDEYVTPHDDDLPDVTGGVPNQREVKDTLATEGAKKAFAFFGVSVEEDIDKEKFANVARKIMPLAFGAVAVGAAYSGVPQRLSGITVGSAVGSIGASEESANRAVRIRNAQAAPSYRRL